MKTNVRFQVSLNQFFCLSVFHTLHFAVPSETWELKLVLVANLVEKCICSPSPRLTSAQNEQGHLLRLLDKTRMCHVLLVLLKGVKHGFEED